MAPRHDTHEADRDPHRRRRRPRPQRGHQERRLPRDRARLRGPRHPPRLGGPDPHPARARSRDPDYLRPLDRINTRTIDRTGGTILHTSRTNPRKMRADGLPPWMDDGRRGRATRPATGLYDLTPLVLDNIERLGLDYPGHDRRRRHAVVLAGPRRRTACRSSRSPRRWTTTSRAPSTASASRRRSRGPRRPSTGSGRRSAVARADRRVPDLRPRRRVLGAVHGVRDVGALRHPRGAVRPRRAGRRSWPRTSAANPSRYAFVITAEGAIWQGAHDRPTSARPTRSATATRPTSARRWPTSSERGPASRRSPPS